MVRISAEPLDVVALTESLHDPSTGAVVTFEGRVRDNSAGRVVVALEYEAYEALAVREGERILAEARTRFAVERLALVHRSGSLLVGDCAVWVGVSAPHRADAFAACQYVVDELKARLPIWKHEHYAEGAPAWIGSHEHAVAQEHTVAHEHEVAPEHEATHEHAVDRGHAAAQEHTVAREHAVAQEAGRSDRR